MPFERPLPLLIQPDAGGTQTGKNVDDFFVQVMLGFRFAAGLDLDDVGIIPQLFVWNANYGSGAALPLPSTEFESLQVIKRIINDVLDAFPLNPILVGIGNDIVF